MCRPASFKVTREKALWHPSEDSHEAIEKYHHLDTGFRATSKHVSVELVPPRQDYCLSFDQWEFHTDQTDLPDWYSIEWAEQMCRDALPAWAEKHLGDHISLPLSDGTTREFCFVNYSLYLSGTQVSDLGQLQSVGGSLDLSGTQVSDLGQLQSVGGSLYLRGTQVSDLGQLQSVGGSLDLRGTQMSDLPEWAIRKIIK